MIDDKLIRHLYTQFPLLMCILQGMLREKRLLASHKVTKCIGRIRRATVSAGSVTRDIR